MVAKEFCEKSELLKALIQSILEDNPENLPSQLKSLIARLGRDSSEALNQKIRGDIEKLFQYQPNSNKTIRNVYLTGDQNRDTRRIYDIKKNAELPATQSFADEGKDVAVIKINGITAAPTLRFANSDDVREEDLIKVIGYPTLADEEVSEQSWAKASVTAGKISAVKDTKRSDVRIFQVDVAVTPGHSGSPLLNSKGEVIGIISWRWEEGNGDTIPVAITSNTAKEFVRQAGAPLDVESSSDRLFREGLEFYEKGDYDGAKSKFEEVKRTFPQHSEVDEFLTKTQQKRNEVLDRDRKQAPIIWGLVGLGSFAALAAAYFWLHNRKRQPSFETGLAPSGVEPLPTRAAAPSKISSFFRPSTVVSQPFLELKNASDKHQRFYLRKSEHRLGRDRRWADLYLPDEGWEVVSRQHATLKREGSDYRIFDNHSANKVLINGNPIPDEGYLLRDDDELKIGHDPKSVVSIAYSNSSHQRSLSSPIQ
jgi:TolA-binding protein